MRARALLFTATIPYEILKSCFQIYDSEVISLRLKFDPESFRVLRHMSTARDDASQPCASDSSVLQSPDSDHRPPGPGLPLPYMTGSSVPGMRDPFPASGRAMCSGSGGNTLCAIVCWSVS